MKRKTNKTNATSKTSKTNKTSKAASKAASKTRAADIVEASKASKAVAGLAASKLARDKKWQKLSSVGRAGCDAFGCTSKDRLFLAFQDCRAAGIRLTRDMMNALEPQNGGSNWLAKWAKAASLPLGPDAELQKRPAFAVRVLQYKGSKANAAALQGELAKLAKTPISDAKSHDLSIARLAKARKLAKV